ncbi:MAG: metal ABC transporter ATP-binding protein [Pseudomonadota bacterium]|nr:metal ABC transporter ATP-binding protein [Pseudomonadota bacterium]
MSTLESGTPMPADPVIRIHGLRLGYGSRPVIEAVDLRIIAGEFWFLLGQNGTGKSTLLSALLGLLRPQAGTIIRHPEFASRERIGFVPQRCGMNPNLPTTVREFVRLGLAGLRIDRKGRADRMAWALEKVGLQGHETENYWSLSGGQRQRVVVARALARRPSLLIMDEPTAGLDPAAETTLLGDIAGLNRHEGLTVICVSHDLATAARYASNVALFHGGHVQAGPAREVLTAENIARVYGVGLDVHWRNDRPTAADDRPGTLS